MSAIKQLLPDVEYDEPEDDSHVDAAYDLHRLVRVTKTMIEATGGVFMDDTADQACGAVRDLIHEIEHRHNNRPDGFTRIESDDRFGTNDVPF